MHPSIVLAAALAAGASLPAFAQPPAGEHACVRRDAPPASVEDEGPDAPFDAAAETLDEAVWTRAAAAGVKLDSDACRLVAPDGHALTRREVEALKAAAAKSPKPKKPDAKDLDGARAAAAGVGSGTVDGKQRFDGGTPGGGTGPALPGGNAAALPPEARLSAALNADLAKKYTEDEAGRGLLAHFTASDGTVRLPGMILVDFGQRASATYNSELGMIKVDQTIAAEAVVAGAPPGERKALARSLAARGGVVDPAKLAAYLVSHPEARAALLDEQAGTFFHETFHAWQQRRDPPVDALRSVDPLEHEREAIREEMRYFNERVARDPSLYDRASLIDRDMYTTLLSGYAEFKTHVDAVYQDNYGKEYFQDFPTIAAQLKGGDRQAVDQVAAEYEKRENDFAAHVLPGMQAAAYPLLIGRQLAAGRPVEALTLAAQAPDEIRGARGPAAAAAVLDFLRSDPPPPPAVRMDAWSVYIAYQTKATGSNILPSDVFLVYARDCRAEVERRLAEAAKAPTKEKRQDALDWAKFYAGPLPDKDALLKRIGAAAQSAAR